MKDELNDIWNMLVDTADKCGFKLINDNACCKILAWLHAYGGGYEAVTQDKNLSNHILYAQKRLNLFGGEIPNIELFSTLQKYLKECEGYVKREKNFVHPDWIIEIFKKYNLSIPK